MQEEEGLNCTGLLDTLLEEFNFQRDQVGLSPTLYLLP